jgi:beta-glucosidase
MTNEEKARLVTGYGILEEHKEVTAGTLREGACGSTAAIERLGIPSIYMADGAAGLRIAANNTGYPSSAAMASTWDADMVQKVAAAMGRDAKALVLICCLRRE